MCFKHGITRRTIYSTILVLSVLAGRLPNSSHFLNESLLSGVQNKRSPSLVRRVRFKVLNFVSSRQHPFAPPPHNRQPRPLVQRLCGLSTSVRLDVICPNRLVICPVVRFRLRVHLPLGFLTVTLPSPYFNSGGSRHPTLAVWHSRQNFLTYSILRYLLKIRRRPVVVYL